MLPSVESGLARYRLIRLLGRGGLGEVYLAHDSSLNRQVAIKFVAPERLGNEDGRRRLLHEARTTAALDHASICTVYEAGEAPDGRAFIAMQYVEGEPLSAVLQRGPMRPRDALALCSHIADGLAAAHRKGIVHRDLKPANVMVTPSGLPKLVDFGIAKVIVAAAALGDLSTTTGTIEGDHLVGTPAYMSPEQVLQEPLDGRSDLFSLGSVLFECLTGRRAFSGRTAHDTTGQILNVYPPAPSSLQPAVTAEEDELCRRLLAKHPADRFQSADEVVGAIRLLLPDTSRATDRPKLPTARRWLRWVAAAAIVATLGVSAALWNRRTLPAAPPNAEKWYQMGTEAVRQGAYDSGRKALLQAVNLYPQYALAYGRLAEADAELDDGRAARDHLLQLSQLVPDESRLPPVERLRIAALRALVLRDVDTSVSLYQQVLDANQHDPGAWLDLGRAQETAGRRSDARASYEAAIARDRQYAAAYLRLGVLQGLESRRDEALAAFAEAERLYRARSDGEGETEVLIRRGVALDALAEIKPARTDLERALMLATNAGNLSQRVRTQLALSSVMAWEGRFAESQQVASDAVAAALGGGLDTVAADGLVTLAGSLMEARRFAGAEQQARRAVQLADKQVARFTAARARVLFASIIVERDRNDEALAEVTSVMPFLKENRYRRVELNALSVASRARLNLDQLEESRQLAANVLAAAEALKDEVQIATAAASMSGVEALLGRLPQALRLRQRAEEIKRRLGDHSTLPYEITNHADLLIRLGRRDEADALLREIDEGIVKGIESYKTRATRARFLRGLEATTSLRCDLSLKLLASAAAPIPASGSSSLAPVLASYCSARLGRHTPVDLAPLERVDSSQAREGHYWLACADIITGDATGALTHARAGLRLLGQIPNDELRWRLMTVGALAARRLNNPDADSMTADAVRTLERLRASWPTDFDSYIGRADLSDLRHRSRHH